MQKNELTLSSLSKTWLIDLDGTMMKHNGYKIDGHDTIIDKSLQFIKSLPDCDKIIFLTSRTDVFKAQTEEFLNKCGIRYDHIIYGLPLGERILINDRKPSGLPTAIAVNIGRDMGIDIDLRIDYKL